MDSERESDHFLKEETVDSGHMDDHFERDGAFANFRLPRHFLGKPYKVYGPSILVFFATSLLWGSVLLYVIMRPPRVYHYRMKDGAPLEQSQLYGLPISGFNFLMCGTSIQEAKALGCEYDILANHWLPRPCFDQEAVTEYQGDESWYAFAQANRTEPIGLEAMGERLQYYTSERDHIVHCAMLWRKQFRMFAEGRKIVDSITADYEHVSHCSKYLIDMTDRGQDFRTVPLRVDVGFAGCYVTD